MCKCVRNKKGLTLVEIIISLAILAVIVVPLGGLFINSVMVNRKAEVQLRANRVAQQYMEQYKVKDFDSLSIAMTSYTVDDMVIEVHVTSLEPLAVEAEIALDVLLSDSAIEFIVAGVSEFSTATLGRTGLRLDFEGTDYADNVRIMDGPNLLHTIHDLHGSTSDKTSVNIFIDSNMVFNFELSNVSNNSVGPLEVHKYVNETATDNSTLAIVNGHITIFEHEGRFTEADRLQTAGLIITVKVLVDSELITEMTQVKKFEW